MLDLSRLNPPQREAVLCTEGPLLVLAGAGSGKTRVLTHRIARLIETGVPAWSILAITFTNKAAREMGERLVSLSAQSADDAWVMTFHACCARILRRDIEKLGYKRSFSIYDDDDQRSLIKSLLAALKLDEKVYTVQAVRAAISDAKNKLMTPAEKCEEIVAGCTAATWGCVDCKKALLVSLEQFLGPIHARRAELDAHPEMVDALLEEGNRRAREESEKTLAGLRHLLNLDF